MSKGKMLLNASISLKSIISSLPADFLLLIIVKGARGELRICKGGRHGFYEIYRDIRFISLKKLSHVSPGMYRRNNE